MIFGPLSTHSAIWYRVSPVCKPNPPFTAPFSNFTGKGIYLLYKIRSNQFLFVFMYLSVAKFICRHRMAPIYKYIYIYMCTPAKSVRIVIIYIYIYTCAYIYMSSSFPKRIKTHSKKCLCNVSAKLDYYVIEKSFSHMNKCVYMYIFMKSSFPKDDL